GAGSGGGSSAGGSSGGSDGGGASASPAPSTGSSHGSSSGAQAAIAYARAQIGKPYEWAADGPGSFDCSGLTMRAWQQGGVPLPHYTVAQYQQSEKVGLGEIRPGDLVFFASGSSPSSIYHVGLYIGDGQMIEAPYTGENVRVSSIWRSSLYGAARP
ncbi:MAG: C40 family peptidase, partial [Actinomycetes bacterium]